MLTRRSVVGSLLATSFIPDISARAQDVYPSRPIRSICSFTPGSGADILVRFFSNKLQEVSGKTVIVENKIGAAGNLGTEFVARSKPDGYTIYICPAVNVLASAKYFYKALAFDPVEDFEHITTLAKAPLLLVVEANTPFKTARDLAEDLKKRGTAGGYAAISNSSQVLCEMFKAQFGLETTEVRFRDFPSALGEMRTGNVSYTYLDAAQATGHVAAGRIRVLATSSSERIASLPASYPTSIEAGIANTDIMFWWSVQVAKGTPKPILDQLETWFNKVVELDDTKKFLEQFGQAPFPGNPQMLKAALTKEVRDWAAYTKLAKVEPQ
jgi:tripartite-type tricarboxylate transporter receptor subunit TctC